MSEHQSFGERIHLAGENLVDQVEQLIHEGNVRKIVVKNGTSTVAEFPLTVGLVGALLAPTLAGIAALVALFSDCTIEVERTIPEAPETAPRD